jgi:heparan-alpha-glucosaminide N-acetyltransferase
MPSRLHSLDIFRGLTILTMIFVNDVASVANIPWWLKHMPQTEDGMTFVDVVFPAFLFIVGMSIPYAIDRRLRDGASALSVMKHVALRTAGLLFLGILMVNMHGVNAEATGMTRSWWSLLVFLAAIPLWMVFPQEQKRTSLVIKSVAFGAMAILMYLYRGGSGGNLHWLQTSWWGILGLIGWAYLVSSVVYLIFRKKVAVVAGMAGGFILMYVGDNSGIFNFLPIIREYIFIGGHLGGHSLITSAGVVTAMVIRNNIQFPNPFRRLQILFVYAAILAMFGYYLAPLYGINKVGATPAWCLYCASICTVIFIALYYFVDMKGYKAWAGFFAPAGENPLLAYILPDIYYALIGILSISFAGTVFGSGMPGIFRSLVVAVLAVQVAGVLTRWNVRMRF